MGPTVIRGSEAPFYVVGIGASAGGLEALERFFDHVPEESGMAYVVVQHLSPDFKSVMDELLARHTRVPIKHVENGMRIEPNHIYLIPPKKEMIVSAGRLLLSERERHHELTLPIDVFFRSLAQDCGRHSVAIVLSGGGSDGSRGIRDVHEAGGLVVVQDVASAQFDSMPKTARDVGVADWVLPPEEMPNVLLDHARAAKMPPPQRTGNVSTMPAVDAIYQLLQAEYGIDFTHYKPSTVTRRIERRLRLSRSDDAESYLERLRRQKGELDILYRDLLIGVTRFFRNEAAFEILEQRVLPELFARGHRDEPLRVWVAGCATGEEVYSLAIVLSELAGSYGDRPVKIFASDVHRGSLEVAARAIYDAQSVKNVSPSRLERYFVARGDAFQVAPEIRQMIVFAPHNVITDAPFTRMDLITCRNLLIYLQPSVQQKVLNVFHFALNRGGVVFLGPSESPGVLLRDFETIDAHWRMYRKFSDVRMPVEVRLRAPAASLRLASAVPSGPVGRYSLTQLLGTYDALLDEHMPPSLLVTEHGEVVHAFGGGSRFLKLRDGRQNLDILDTVDAELKMVLVGGLKRALKEPSAIVFTGVRIAEKDAESLYRVTIRQVNPRSGSGGARHLLIALERLDAEPRPPNQTEIDLRQMSRDQLAALETELTYTKENLQAAIEELETGNEELQAANEELLASNEELQSTNEELQSVNEELYTVNAEYQRKISELTELTNDMDNLLSSTDIGTIFLDAELRIRKLTPRIADTFNLLPQDVGRPLEAFTHTIDQPELIPDLRRVLAGAAPIEREIHDRRGRAFILRILPYRAKAGVQGVVLTLLDVTGLKTAEDALFHERHLLNGLLANVPDAIYFRDAHGKFIRVNHAMASWLGIADPRAALGKTAFEICPHDVALSLHSEDENVVKTGEAQLYRLEKYSRRGADEWHVVTRLPLRDPKGAVVGVIGIYRDVTELKRAEQRVHEAVQRRDQFLAMLSHELRNPLGAIVTATALLSNGSRADDPAVERLIRIVDRQSQQMARLLDDLLEASRVTQNKIELRRRVVDLGAVVREAAEAARGMMDSRGVELRSDIGSEPIWVDGDPARLQQLQMNMLGNAAKYTPRGGTVQLSVKREGSFAIIRVKDDGVGIAKDMLDAVFDLFVQSNSTLDRADGGLGLGLTLVRSLVTMHGGTVSAHSDGPGAGAEFVVRLPIARTLPEELAAPRQPKLPEGVVPRIVIVEDNVDSREMLHQLLSLAGFECHAADDGDRALEIMKDVGPNVAIVDVGLPGMDGFELARHIRAQPSHANVYLIALTGYGQAADRARALDAGFDEHLVKPVNPENLMKLLARGRTLDRATN